MFCAGFSYTRSFTHPYLVSREGRLLIMHDGPRRRVDGYRTAEIVSPHLPVEEVIAGIEHLRAGSPPHLKKITLCAITPGLEVCTDTRDAYKEMGYRLLATEPMMVSKTALAPALTSAATISRVTDQDAADKISRAAGSRQIRTKELTEDPPKLRLYAAEVDGEAVGWVRSILRTPGIAWVSNMYVKPDFRRQGIAKALLSHMLQDDARHGATTSVLLASHAGAQLYPAVGYEQIGTLHVFSPVAK